MDARELIDKLRDIRYELSDTWNCDAIWELTELIRNLAKENGIVLNKEEEEEWDKYLGIEEAEGDED